MINEVKVRKKYERLTKFLIQKNLSITTMESATSGQIASLITDTEGASAVMKGAFITYCNEAKIMQGVPANIIEKYSVYSLETAKSMAKACKEAYQADIGIGVTGTMGNIDPYNPKDSQVGVVYFSIAFGDTIVADRCEIEPQNTRLLYKLAVAKVIYEKLDELLQIES